MLENGRVGRRSNAFQERAAIEGRDPMKVSLDRMQVVLLRRSNVILHCDVKAQGRKADVADAILMGFLREERSSRELPSSFLGADDLDAATFDGDEIGAGELGVFGSAFTGAKGLFGNHRYLLTARRPPE